MEHTALQVSGQDELELKEKEVTAEKGPKPQLRASVCAGLLEPQPRASVCAGLLEPQPRALSVLVYLSSLKENHRPDSSSNPKVLPLGPRVQGFILRPLSSTGRGLFGLNRNINP